MIIVRNVFTAKPGQASKLAAQMKAAAIAGGAPNPRVMTDLTGEFNRVVLEFEVQDIAEWAAQMANYASNEKMRDAMKGYTELFSTGHRELLQVV